jgi:hypothetical protein
MLGALAATAVCALVRWPGHPAMGSGTHFRLAVGRR